MTRPRRIQLLVALNQVASWRRYARALEDRDRPDLQLEVYRWRVFWARVALARRAEARAT